MRIHGIMVKRIFALPKKSPFTLFLPVSLLVASLHAEEDPIGHESFLYPIDLYFAVGAEYSVSDIEITDINASVVWTDVLAPPSLPDMEIDDLGNAESTSLHSSFKLGYRLPFAQTISIEGVISPKRTVRIRMSGSEPLFQAENMDPFWSVAPEDLSAGIGHDYAFSDIALSGSLAEVEVFSPQFSLIFRPVVHKRLKPIVGFGVHYLMFSDLEIREDTLQGSTNSESLSGSIQNAMGWIAQIGLEYQLTDMWFVGTEFKYSDVSDVKVEIVDLNIPIVESQGLSDTNGGLAPLETLSTLPMYVTSADTRLNIRTTAFSVWAGFNF